MKIRNRILSLFAVVTLLSSCYKDLGNYEYKEINEVDIQGVDDVYARDIDEELSIEPNYVGTQYSDTTKFTFKWTVDGREVSQYANFKTIVDFAPGQRVGRLIITDKETQVKTFKKFTINVSSSTAGDLYVILSKSRGKAELSYLRLDKPSNFVVNYYEGRTGKALGINPQQLCMIDLNLSTSYAYPFTKGYGRMLTLVDNNAYLFDKHTLQIDTVTRYLSADTYTGLVAYPPPTIELYKTEFLLDVVGMWRVLDNGTRQEGTAFAELSGGSLYRFNFASNAASSSTRTYNKKTPYEGGKGYFSPFCFFDDITNTAPRYQWQQGNDLGNIILFDNVNGRFAFAPSDAPYSISTEQIKAYPGHDLIWGSDTNNKDLSVAVLTQGGASRMLLLGKTGSGSSAKYAVSAEVVTTSVINSSTRFHSMKYSPYIFFVTGNKIYNYNILEAINMIAPSEKNLVAKLSDYGYDESAVITDLCISRSERTMLLGVSRYGGDSEALGEENKGDLVVLNLNNSTFELSKKEIYKGVAGIPVDVQIKYQSYYRDGKDKDGLFKDII